jgi:hypothetical protein
MGLSGAVDGGYMSIDYDKLRSLAIPDAETHYSERDTMLYALSLGLGADPHD